MFSEKHPIKSLELNKKRCGEEYLGYSFILLCRACVIYQVRCSVWAVDFFAFRNFAVAFEADFLLLAPVAISRNQFFYHHSLADY